MGRKCFVPGCRSGYHKEKNRVSLFSAPKHKLEEWEKLIGREDKPLTLKDNICEKHFKTEFIIREITTSVYSYPLQKPRLSENAIPTIFPASPKHKRHRKFVIKCNNIDIENYRESAIVDPLSNETLFDQLWNESISIKLPSKSWALHYVQTEDCRKVSISEMILLNDGENTAIRKKIILSEDSFHTYVFEHLVRHYSFLQDRYFYSASELEEALNKIEKLHVCVGANFEEKNLNNPCFYRDALFNVWRHIRCSFLMNAQTRNETCNLCDKYNNLAASSEAANKILRKRKRSTSPAKIKKKQKLIMKRSN